MAPYSGPSRLPLYPLLPPAGGGPLPPVACKEGSSPGSVLPFPSLCGSRQPACPWSEALRSSVGEAGPHCARPCLLLPCPPPVPGGPGKSCVTDCTKTFLKPIFRDFCPAGWGGSGCLPCQGSCCRQNIWGSVDSRGICWLPGASQGLELTLQTCLVPSLHLPGPSSGLPHAPKGCDRGGPKREESPVPLWPNHTPEHCGQQGPGRPGCLLPPPLQGQHDCTLAASALLTTLPSAPQGRQPPPPPTPRRKPSLQGRRGPREHCGEPAPPLPRPTATFLLGSTHHCVGFFFHK